MTRDPAATGITMSNAKRERLVALAREYNFYVVADEVSSKYVGK